MAEILFQRDGLDELAARLRARGARRALLLVAPSRRHVDRAVAALAALDLVIFDGARVHVPAEVVEAAAGVLAGCGADVLVSIGGGAAIGLGKALRLDHPVGFAAVPTTYSGSEMTSVYGITRGADKRTGRDPRVRPDLVLYDATLSAGLPLPLTIQSLMNALSHVVGVLSTGSLAGEPRAEALAAARTLTQAMEALVAAPADLDARERALRGGCAAGLALDRGTLGPQHALAHLLGGGLRLDHAALHAVLLPRYLAHLRGSAPALVDELGRAAGQPDLDAWLRALMARTGVPASLADLGADDREVKRLLASRPDLPDLLG